MSRKLVVLALLFVVLAGVAGAYLGVFQKWNKHDPFQSLLLTNAFLQSNFGFAFRGSSSEYAPIALVCNEKAPRNPTETNLGQYTYCQNNGNPLKVSIAWAKADVIFKDYLNRIANTVMKDKGNGSGNFVCVEDTGFLKKNSLSGVLSDCRVTSSNGETYYYSAFFFYPPTHPEITQVLYVYDGDGATDESGVRAMVRNLASGVIF